MLRCVLKRGELHRVLRWRELLRRLQWYLLWMWVFWALILLLLLLLLLILLMLLLLVWLRVELLDVRPWCRLAVRGHVSVSGDVWHRSGGAVTCVDFALTLGQVLSGMIQGWLGKNGISGCSDD